MKQLPSYSHPHPALHTPRDPWPEGSKVGNVSHNLPPFNYTDPLTNKTSPEIRNFWEAPQSLGHMLDANCSSSWVFQTEAERTAVSYTLKKNKGQVHLLLAEHEVSEHQACPLHSSKGIFLFILAAGQGKDCIKMQKIYLGLSY